MELEFLSYCHHRLSGNQFAVFSTLHVLGECVITQREIGDIMNTGTSRISIHMTALRKLGFIDYQALGFIGLDLYWVRRSAKQEPPGNKSLLKQQYRWTLVHETGETVRLTHGNIAQFARERSLRSDSVRYLIQGKWQHYKGWRIG